MKIVLPPGVAKLATTQRPVGMTTTTALENTPPILEEGGASSG